MGKNIIARKEKKTDLAWKITSNMAERYLKECLESVGEKVTSDMERGGKSKLLQQTMAASVDKRNIENPKEKELNRIRRLEEMTRSAIMKKRIIDGEAVNHEEKTKEWTEAKKEGKILLAKAELLVLWNKIQKELQQMKLPCKILYGTTNPKLGHIQWAVNVTTAKRKNMEKL